MSDNEILDKIINKLQEKDVCANVNDIKDFHLTLSGSECELVYKFSCKDKTYYYVINTMSENLYEA
jgi:hypothetical protein